MTPLHRFGFWFLTLATAASAPGQTSVTNARPSDLAPTEVVFLGALHDFHQKNPHYSLQVLRDLIVSLKAHAILVEVPETSGGKPTVREGRLVEEYAKRNEFRACQEAADALKISIHPFDMDRLDDIRRETRFWQRQREAQKAYAAFMQAHKDDEGVAELRIHASFDEGMEKSIVTFAEKGTPEIINSEAFDSIVRAAKQLRPVINAARDRVIQAHPQEGLVLRGLDFVAEEWRRRNECMAENIEAHAKQYQSKRLVVVVGAEHRYALRDLLRARTTLTCKEYWELDDRQPRGAP